MTSVPFLIHLSFLSFLSLSLSVRIHVHRSSVGLSLSISIHPFVSHRDRIPMTWRAVCGLLGRHRVRAVLLAAGGLPAFVDIKSVDLRVREVLLPGPMGRTAVSDMPADPERLPERRCAGQGAVRVP